MDIEKMKRLMAENPPVVDEVHSAGAYFNWGWTGCGYGQFSFGMKDGVWYCDNEMMGPESTRKILHAFADHVADQLKPIIEADMADWEARQKKREEMENGGTVREGEGAGGENVPPAGT